MAAVSRDADVAVHLASLLDRIKHKVDAEEGRALLTVRAPLAEGRHCEVHVAAGAESEESRQFS